MIVLQSLKIASLTRSTRKALTKTPKNQDCFINQILCVSRIGIVCELSSNELFADNLVYAFPSLKAGTETRYYSDEVKINFELDRLLDLRRETPGRSQLNLTKGQLRRRRI